MQVCYYEINFDKKELTEVNSNRDSSGNKLQGTFIKKAFLNLYYRNEFEDKARTRLIGLRPTKEAQDEFIRSCVSTPSGFGLMTEHHEQITRLTIKSGRIAIEEMEALF